MGSGLMVGREEPRHCPIQVLRAPPRHDRRRERSEGLAWFDPLDPGKLDQHCLKLVQRTRGLPSHGAGLQALETREETGERSSAELGVLETLVADEAEHRRQREVHHLGQLYIPHVGHLQELGSLGAAAPLGQGVMECAVEAPAAHVFAELIADTGHGGDAQMLVLDKHLPFLEMRNRKRGE